MEVKEFTCLTVTVKQAALLLGLNPQTIYRYIRDGKIRRTPHGGRIPLGEIERWLGKAAAESDVNG
jgi:excisionase family DNA binding protein